MNRVSEFFRRIAGEFVVRQLDRRLQRFEQRLHNAHAIQRKLLFNKIRRCAESSFGRDHHFGEIQTLADFRNNIPIAQYDYYFPYIQRVTEGDVEAMFPAGEKLLMFTLSSGTTGYPKLIPINKIWMNEYRRGWQMWGIKAFRDHPPIFAAKVLNIVGSWDVQRTPSGVPCGQASGMSSRIQNPLLRMIYSVPPSVFEIEDSAARDYATLRLAIADDVRLFSTAIPATAVKFAKLGDQYRETLIRDIADGTLSTDFDVPKSVRHEINRRIRRPNLQRAGELEKIINSTGHLYPKDYWNLALVACWVGGTVGTESRHICEYYGDVPCRDIGLVSSEGRVSIPLQDGSSSGVLDIESHYYEFIPEEEIESTQPTVLECHELEEGKKYFILMTTSGGLYRYNIYDLVLCTGYLGEAPLLEFLNKGQHFSDMEGEKITEYHVVTAVDEIVDRMGLKIGSFTAVPVRPSNDSPYYAIMLDERDITDQESACRFLEGVDRNLAQSNIAYEIRRAEGYLGPPHLLRIHSGSLNDYHQGELKRCGAGQDQYKQSSLVLDESFLVKFPSTEEFAPIKTAKRRSAA